MSNVNVFGGGTTSGSSGGASGSSVIDLSGVDFLSFYSSNDSFAQLIIDSFNAGYGIRVPALEIVLQNNTELANTEEIPNTLNDSVSYLNDVVTQISLLPIGYLVSIFIPSNTLVNNEDVSDITYQNEGNGTWQLIAGYPFNTEIPTEPYNEYNDGSNNP